MLCEEALNLYRCKEWLCARRFELQAPVLKQPSSILFVARTLFEFGPEPLLLALKLSTKPGESSVEENRWTFCSQLRGN